MALENESKSEESPKSQEWTRIVNKQSTKTTPHETLNIQNQFEVLKVY